MDYELIINELNNKINQLDIKNSELSERIQELEKESEKLRAKKSLFSKKVEQSPYYSSIFVFLILMIISLLIIYK